MTQWLLEFDKVYYTYPASSIPALNELTLRLPAGKKSVLLGYNGCGKSTLLYLADGLYKPQRGIIRWQGKPIKYDRRSLAKLREQVGLVFQDPEQQLVAATVEEDISYGLCNLGLPAAEIEQRVAQALADFDLQEVATRPIHHLSLGQKKRVALAGVTVLQPQLLLLDEPTAYLDPLQVRQLIANLQTIHANGTTLLMATHDLDLAYQWADWIFVMHQGKVILEGSAATVFSQRTILEDLQFGLPLIWEVWAALPSELRSQFGECPPPKTIDELRRLLFLLNNP
ncbi:MAG: energy-coupling factor ABC transporter ATP-binding protein [Oscillatoriaceae bacterium SKW80]|nr:energy-coupling factor ABC transporter ATP-binding protein [Oscillatoriaceae bacterium SKYG93]MCX8120881.1 energy-coupling factor ABC transporter ATP-binding protein [Oscillatoriaceae bacterium SKW80]MDW8452154.1 ABC transporter ATP-binding protein [Oscillatoriaceae cyanobacterium SKYGB_i_bin93]HIK27364.1 ABC transporter ATP-binding protein [Oscillatoriaceae cyanobacterium M7585_C2015_266]